jgi:predicted acyltransferase
MRSSDERRETLPPDQRIEVRIHPRQSIRRLAWLAVGIALTAFAIFEVVVHDLGPAPILVFAVLPDLAFLVGIGQPHERGQLPSRAVPAYNLAHRPLVALAVIALALAGLLAARLLKQAPAEFEAARRIPLVVYVAGVTWLAHIALDRALGFGLRTPEGWQRSTRSDGQ